MYRSTTSMKNLAIHQSNKMDKPDTIPRRLVLEWSVEHSVELEREREGWVLCLGCCPHDPDSDK